MIIISDSFDKVYAKFEVVLLVFFLRYFKYFFIYLSICFALFDIFLRHRQNNSTKKLLNLIFQICL